MLLDEPSNHLDIEATEWLEDFLVESSAAMVLVSHDRYFLDKVTNRTLELFRGTVDSYTGNFSAYWRQKAERLLVQRRTYEKQQTGNRQGQGVHSPQPLRAEARPGRGPPQEAGADRAGAAAAGDPRAADGLSAGRPLRRHRRSAPSGLGKVLRAAAVRRRRRADHPRPALGAAGAQRLRQDDAAALPAGAGTARRGHVRLGQGVARGLLRSATGRTGRRATPAVDAIRPPHKQFNDQQRRDLLARFGLSGDTALQQVGSLSGGERAGRRWPGWPPRTPISSSSTSPPTTSTSGPATPWSGRCWSSTAPCSSSATTATSSIAWPITVDSRRRQVRVVEGNYEAYQLRAGRKAAEADRRRKAGQRRKPAKDRKEEAPAPRKRRFPYRKVADLEDEIFERETCVENLQEELARGETHRDGQRVPPDQGRRSPSTRRRWRRSTALGRGRRDELVADRAVPRLCQPCKL